MFIREANVRVCLSANWSPSISKSATRGIHEVDGLTDPNKERHQMPIDSPKNGITLHLVIFDGFDVRSSSKVKNIAVTFVEFTGKLGRDLL